MNIFKILMLALFIITSGYSLYLLFNSDYYSSALWLVLPFTLMAMIVSVLGFFFGGKKK